MSMTIRPSGSPNSSSSEASGLLRHGDQRLDRVLVQQHRRRLIPAEGRTLHVAALGADHRVQPQPHFVGAFGGN